MSDTYDKHRRSAASRGYGHRWRKARATFLARNPLCAMCWQQGRRTAATVVDHITPHRGDSRLFWDTKKNWQALCDTHHNAVKQREEKYGVVVGCDLNGRPLDLNHLWNRSST